MSTPTDNFNNVLTFAPIPDGDLVLECEDVLSDEVTTGLREQLESRLPGRKIVVLTGGPRLTAIDNRETLARIEQKLDDLLSSRVAGTQRSSPYPVA